MLPTIAQAFPPINLDELVQGTRQFPNMPLEEKAQFIDRLVGSHPVINLEWGSGHRFRRVRQLEPGDQPPGHVSGVVWRTDVPAAPGRANPTGRPILYLADRQDTALREVHVANDWVVVAEFGIRRGRTIRLCPVGELFQIVRTGRGFLINGEHASAISSLMNACPLRDQRSLAITDAFLYEQLVGHDDYEATCLVTTAIFRKLGAVSAIAYSSRRQSGAINLAVRTEDFWENWGLFGARHGLAEHLAAGFYRLRSVRHLAGVTHAGDFEWDEEPRNDDAVALLDPPYFPQKA